MLTLLPFILIYAGVALAAFGPAAGVTTLIFGLLQFTFSYLLLGRRSVNRTVFIVNLYGLVLMGISLASAWQSVSIGGRYDPFLSGSDGTGYFSQAIYLSERGLFSGLGGLTGNYFGYQFVLGALFRLTGPDLPSGLLLNDLCLTASAALVALSTLRITKDKSAAFWAVIMFAFMCRLIYYSNLLLKEPFLVLGVALCLHAFSLLVAGKRGRVQAIASLLFAATIFATMRAPMLAVPIALVALMGRNLVREGWLVGVAGFGIFAVLSAVFARFTSYEFTAGFVSDTVLNNRVLSSSFDAGIDDSGVVGQFLSFYGGLPTPVRLAAIPLPMTAQFFLPFDFWSSKFLDRQFISFFSNNLSPIWFLLTGPIFIVALALRGSIPSKTAQSLLLVSAGFYALTAFIFSGVVPRYSDPYLILALPAMGYLFANWKRNGTTAVRTTALLQYYYVAFFVGAILYAAFKVLH